MGPPRETLVPRHNLLMNGIAEWFTSHRRLGVVLLGAASVLYVGLLVEAAATRKPWNDEAMAAQAAYNLGAEGRTGVDFGDEKSPFLPGIKQHTYYIFPFQLCVLAVWYKVAGFSLLSTRVISIVWTLLMLAAINQLIWCLTKSRGMALLATVLTAVDYHIMNEAAFGRYDTMVAALGFGAYALFLSLRQKHFIAAIALSNCCIAMAGATHPNGLLFFLGLWFLVIYFDRSKLGWRMLGAAAIPYVVGAVFWAKYIFEDFRSFQGQLAMNSGGRYGILHPVETLIREIEYRYIRPYGLGPHSVGHTGGYIRLKAVSLVAYAVGLVGCLSSRSIRSDARIKPLLALLGSTPFFPDLLREHEVLVLPCASCSALLVRAGVVCVGVRKTGPGAEVGCGRYAGDRRRHSDRRDPRQDPSERLRQVVPARS